MSEGLNHVLREFFLEFLWNICRRKIEFMAIFLFFYDLQIFIIFKGVVWNGYFNWISHLGLLFMVRKKILAQLLPVLDYVLLLDLLNKGQFSLTSGRWSHILPHHQIKAMQHLIFTFFKAKLLETENKVNKWWPPSEVPLLIEFTSHFPADWLRWWFSYLIRNACHRRTQRPK